MRETRATARPLFSERRGTGAGDPPVVFLHGLAASGRYWYPVAEHLRDARLRLYLVDLLGFGRSPWPELAYTIDDHLAALDEWRAAAGLAAAPLTLVGHSLGALLALAWLARTPDLAGAALISLPVYHDPAAARRQVGGPLPAALADARLPPVGAADLHGDVSGAAGLAAGGPAGAPPGPARRGPRRRPAHLAFPFRHAEPLHLRAGVRASAPAGARAARDLRAWRRRRDRRGGDRAGAGGGAARRLLGDRAEGGHDLPLSHPAAVADALATFLAPRSAR